MPESLSAGVPEWLKTVWPMVLKTALILVLAPVGMMYLTWLERKVIARMQDRFGPNRVGPYGLLQPLADGIKMLTKEDLVPGGADAMVHLLAPVVIVVPALFLFTVLPVGPEWVAAPLATGLLFFAAIGSTTPLAIFMGGWGSRSKFSVLGAIRNAAQLLAYEVPMILGLAVVPMVVGDLRLPEIVQAQGGQWFLWTPWGGVGFALILTAGLAEVNRTPFDLPEAESELVGGFHTEYSGMKFALFYMAEFLSTLALAALLAVLFLGGWRGPVGPLLPAAFWPPFWMALKTLGLVFVTIWIRGTLPRFRIDQMLELAWKVLIPLGLANLAGAACWVLLPGGWGCLAAVGLAAGTFLVTTQLWLAPKAHCPTHWGDVR